MYIHTDYGRILLKILVGEMAAQPIFKAAEKERCGGGVNRGEALRPFLSVEVSSPSPLNLVTIILNPLSPIPICGTYETRIEATTGREQWEWEKKNLLLMVHH